MCPGCEESWREERVCDDRSKPQSAAASKDHTRVPRQAQCQLQALRQVPRGTL